MHSTIKKKKKSETPIYLPLMQVFCFVLFFTQYVFKIQMTIFSLAPK